MDANSTLSRVCTIVLGKGFPGSFQPLGAQETAGWADGCEDTGKTKLVTNSEIDSRPSSRGSHLPGRLSHRRGGSSSALSSCPSRETHLAPLASREMHVCVCVSEYVYVCVCVYMSVCVREREREAAFCGTVTTGNPHVQGQAWGQPPLGSQGHNCL